MADVEIKYNGSKIAELTGNGKKTLQTAGKYAEADVEVEYTRPEVTQATPGITVSTAGLITASATQAEGYVVAGTKSATKQLTTQAGKTVTPSASSQTAVASGRYTTGAVTVAAVPSETKTATANGTVTPSSGKWLSSVTVAIPEYDGSVT